MPEFSADHFGKCYRYAMSFVILIVAIFFFNVKLSDLAEITHPKKARFFFSSILVKLWFGFPQNKKLLPFPLKGGFLLSIQSKEKI